MPEARLGRRLVLDSAIFFDLLSDEAFFRHVPETCRALEERGKIAYRTALTNVRGETCAGCTSLNEILRPFINDFGVAFAAAPPVQRKPFVDYITKRRGSRPSQILLHYLDTDDRLHSLTL